MSPLSRACGDDHTPDRIQPFSRILIAIQNALRFNFALTLRPVL